MPDQISEFENSGGTPVVVVVDDDELVTTTLSSYLSLETDYEVHTFLSPFDALDFLQKTAPDVVISDFLMPKMDGLEFLARVKKLYPDVTAILLTGYADKENAIKAINEVGLYQYIEKPWENEYLKIMIRNGVSQKNLRVVLKDKIRELDDVLLEKDELAQHTEMLKQELRLAQNVQQSMLPQALPNSNGFSFFAKYEPALEVGGDFYDIIELTQNKLCILIADVTGHGIQAALMTVLLKSTFSTFKETDAAPRDILNYMNNVLNKTLPRGHFVAALVAILDVSNSTLTIVNAGIPHPYLLKREGNRVERIPANGLLLGVAPEEVYKPGHEVDVQLQQGDRVILLTDGLTEAESENQEFFESKLLVPTLMEVSGQPNDEILDTLTEAARQFSKPGHKWDDVTILGLEKH